MRPVRLVVASLAIFVLAIVWNACVHLVILREANAAVESLRRPDMGNKIWLSLGMTAIIALLFVWGYGRVARTGSIWEGLSFGVYVGILAGLLVDVNQYVLYPIPASLAAKWFIGGLVEFSTYGVLVTRLYPVADRSRFVGK
jgi:hypothetical protein